MPIIAVMNRKGGSGKSTLATQIAAWYAANGTSVMLGDSDRQRSASRWLGRRSSSAPAIANWPNDTGRAYRSPFGATHVVIDTPGGLQGLELAKQLARADGVVVPVGPSVFDLETSIDFLQEVRQHPRVASGRCRVTAVGMRWPMDVLLAWQSHATPKPLPLLSVIAEAPNYRECMVSGGSVFDAPAQLHRSDLLQWQPLLDWLAALPQSDHGSAALPAGQAPAEARPREAALPQSLLIPSLLGKRVGREKQLNSPESFVETMPPEGINVEELQALRLQTRTQFALEMGQASAPRGAPVSTYPGLTQRQQDPLALRAATPGAAKSEPGWLTRLFRTR